MDAWNEYSRFFIALLVILDPFFAVPIFLGLTQGVSKRHRGRIATVTALSVFLVLAVAAVLGESLLHTLGASLGSFRVGGGMVLLLMALTMLRADPPAPSTDSASVSANDRDSEGASVAIVPLAIPLLAGPGAISTVIIQVHRSAAPWHLLYTLGCILGVCLVLWLVLKLAIPIGKFLGRTGINIINRLFGLILAAIAVEIIANGLKQLFPALASA